MNRFAMVLSAALPLLAAHAVHAQKLEPGKWTGTVLAPGEQHALEVSYDVTLRGDTIDIRVNAGNHGSFSFSEVKLADKTLTFWFTPGPRVDCTLSRREDGAFAGSCRDPNGGNASMVMIPPKKE
jgi:hypothetical protein